MRRSIGALMAAVVLLTACGGDGDTTGDAGADDPPASSVEDDLELTPEDDSDPEIETETEAETAGPGDDEPDPGEVEAVAVEIPDGFSLNGFRYCEILLTVPGDDGAPSTEVWGTPGVGSCEDEAWYALDPDSLSAEFDASSIHMNGPRYFTTDATIDTAPAVDDGADQPPAEIRNFGDIPMRLLATVGEATTESTPYDPGLVVRTATWGYRAGTEVYELIDPDGNSYLMQSYALIQDPTLTPEDLALLGDRLELPTGWSYVVRVLEADVILGLTPDGAIVVQDEFENSYQQNVIGGIVAPVAAPAEACDAEPNILTTSTGVEFVRTPDACFDGLPDWSYGSQHVDIDGVRQAYVDEGAPNGDVVLLLHGQPSWSYLYRHMIPVFADAGFRVIAMDHAGMGRSDKPIDIDWYSYLGHVDRLERFIAELGLADINLFVQDWGSLTGLKVAGDNPDLFATITVGNGALPEVPDGFEPFPPVENPDVIRDLESPFAGFPDQQLPAYDGCDLLDSSSTEFFGDWMNFAMTGESFRPGAVVEALTWFDLTPAEEAAYDAPFPDRAYLAGPRTFPSLVNELGGSTVEAWVGLESYENPFLTLWAANDPGSLGSCEAQQRLVDRVPGAAGQPHDRLDDASHFLQDDQGAEIAARMVDWLGTVSGQG